MIIVTFLLSFLVGTVKVSADPVILSSDDHSALFFLSWYFDTQFFEEGLFLVIMGSTQEQEGLTIYRWKGNEFKKLFTTTPREGIFNARAVALTPKGDALYLCDFLKGLIYRYRPGATFIRFGQKPNTEALVAYQDFVIRGTKWPSYNLETVGDQALPVLETINSLLPKDAVHVSDGKSNADEMVLALDKHRLALGYNLYSAALIFDLGSGDLLQRCEWKKPFSGYIEPRKDFIGTYQEPQEYMRAMQAWQESFHQLVVLAWHRGKLYGLFRRGIEDQGIWARLNGTTEDPFSWDNNRNEIKLLSIGPDRVMLGRRKEDAEERVTWTLWQSTSLPSL